MFNTLRNLPENANYEVVVEEEEERGDDDEDVISSSEKLFDLILGYMPVSQVNCLIPIDDYREDKETLLLRAFSGFYCLEDNTFCHPRILKKLIAAGADVNYTTARFDTPLLSAYLSNTFFNDNVRVLLEAGAGVRCVDDQWRSVLHQMLYLTPDVINTLMEAGADIEAVDRYGYTPLLQAAISGSVAVVESLLGWGASCHQRSYSGETVLMCAVQYEPVRDYYLERATDGIIDDPNRIRVLVHTFLARIAAAGVDAEGRSVAAANGRGAGATASTGTRIRKREDSASPTRHAPRCHAELER
jgi:hypothetical protein